MMVLHPPKTALNFQDEYEFRSKRAKPIPSRHYCPYENCGKSYTKPCRLTDHLETHTEEVNLSSMGLTVASI